jgi:hypothetical protein
MATASCAPINNQWRETGPAVTEDWNSPTADDVYARFQPAVEKGRDWPAESTAPEDGGVIHGALYFEDPFEDKGAGRTGMNKYYIGWEDYVALAYGYPRFTLNWLGFPVSIIVTPPWTLMRSDGQLSRQALGYDHDAAPIEKTAPWVQVESGAAAEPPPPAEIKPAAPE